MPETRLPRRRWPRVLLAIGASLVSLILVTVIAFTISPWPSVHATTMPWT